MYPQSAGTLQKDRNCLKGDRFVSDVPKTTKTFEVKLFELSKLMTLVHKKSKRLLKFQTVCVNFEKV